MNKAQKYLAILLCCVILFALTACGGTPTGSPSTAASTAPSAAASGSAAPSAAAPSKTPEPAKSAAPKRDTLNAAAYGDTGTLDPVGISGAGSFLNMAAAYMEPMWDYRAGWKIEWILATSVEDLGLNEMKIHLREGVTFSNGNPFTADDVLFTFKLWKATPNRALSVNGVDFDKTKVLDKYTIDVFFSEPTVDKMTGFSTLLVTDGESYNPKEASAKPIGTGPYVIKDYVVNSYVDMTARKDYWGKKANIANLHFRVIEEQSQRVNALSTNTVDMCPVSNQDIGFVKTLPGYNVTLFNGGSCTAMMFNVNKASVFSSQDARYAVSYATDRQAIAKIVYNGFAKVATNPVSTAAKDYEDRFANLSDVYAKGYNLDLAKQYAKSSGLEGKTIRIMTNGAPDFVQTAEIMQASYKQIGVTTQILNYDQATLRSKYRTDASSYDIVLYFTASPFMTISSLVYDTARFSSILNAPGAWEGIDRFMEIGKKALVTTDAKDRSAINLELLQIFSKAVPWFGLNDLQTATAYSKDLADPILWALGAPRYPELAFK